MITPSPAPDAATIATVASLVAWLWNCDDVFSHSTRAGYAFQGGRILDSLGRLASHYCYCCWSVLSPRTLLLRLLTMSKSARPVRQRVKTGTLGEDHECNFPKRNARLPERACCAAGAGGSAATGDGGGRR